MTDTTMIQTTLARESRRRHRTRDTAAAIAWSLWLPLLVLVVIGVLTTTRPSPFFPPLLRVFERFGQVWFGAGFVQHVLPSLSNLALGFLIALVLGIAIGTLLALLPTLDLLLDPFLQFFRALPSIALLPLLMMLLGTSDVSKIALIAYGAFWPILLNTVDGIKAIPPELRQTARSYRLTPYRYLTRVLMPGAYPQASIGIRLSLSIALVLMVGSELYGSSRGIGYFVIDAKNRFFVADMWAGVILLGIIGYLISIGYNALERRMLRWREAAR